MGGKMKNFFFISVLILIDQLSKGVARKFFVEPMEVISNFFVLKTSQNDGIAFSIPFPKLALIILTIVVLGGILWFMKHKKVSSVEETAFLLIFAGAAGNLIDRIFLGSVTDFLAFWSFPIFNFADVFITFGIVLFLFEEVISRRVEK